MRLVISSFVLVCMPPAAAWIGLSCLAGAQVLYTLEADSEGFDLAQVDALGDVNGDGVSDFICGTGVRSGVNGKLLYAFGSGPPDRHWSSACWAGDVNGDGIPDFIAGNATDDTNGERAGKAEVYSGVDGALLYTFRGDSEFDNFGGSVSGAGDVNGDGFADLLVGAHGDDDGALNGGSVRLFSGLDGSVLYTLYWEDVAVGFGQSLCDFADVDGDGLDDFVVGLPGWDRYGTNAGLVRFHSGGDGSLIHEIPGDSVDMALGYAVAKAGDLNADGFPELIVGAPSTDVSSSDEGAVFVHSGSDGSRLYALWGRRWTGNFGAAVDSAGDVDGDGCDDLLIFERGAVIHQGAYIGATHLYSGRDASQLYQHRGRSIRDDLLCLGGLGDVNADGFADFLGLGFGAPGNNDYLQVISGIPLVLEGPHPGLAGEPNTLMLSGADPHGILIFTAGRQWGSTRMPCSGGSFAVAIHKAGILGLRTADATGTAVFSRSVPARLAGRDYLFQAVEFAACRFSNVLAHEFR